ncbi:jg15074 [Pararge aegeria aegeria]|uniref:Jg15074 protein n=1 Tax=Pararge aegeria aegeria TaxID=348720 RepID=A0A8S4QU30_9NEOP|nr:jg15074 [Pararge aegeria aegeria]
MYIYEDSCKEFFRMVMIEGGSLFEKSYFAKHPLDSGHNVASNRSYEILHTCDKGLRLDLREQLEIIKHKNGRFELLNEPINLLTSPLLNIFRGTNEVERV